MPAAARFTSQKRVPLPGSDKTPIAAAATPPETSGAPAPSPPGRVTVSVIVRRKEQIDTRGLARGAGRLSRAEYTRKHGPDPASLKLVKAFAAEFGLKVEPPAVSGTRTLHLSGTAAAMQKAFQVALRSHVVDGISYRVRQGEICLPEELNGHIVAVLGLDNRPQAKPHNRAAVPRASNSSYSPVEVAQLYGFPPKATAKGQTIGIIELGGGSRNSDLKTYFKRLGLPTPAVKTVSVDKGKNTPTNANSADGEVMLDIEVCAAIAPGAKIAVYFAPNTDQGFIDAIVAAVHDKVNKPSVVSISWGGPESNWTRQSMDALDAACQTAATLGVSITVASGDNGSDDGVGDGGKHVDFPASSPHVLACGGTKLTGSGTAIQSEVVWNETAAQEGATGGGVSNVFPLPAWQSNANVPAPGGGSGGRGVPDVAGNADPATGYNVRIDGQDEVIGGTSAVAPLYAGLIALANAANKKSAGFVNPILYKNPKAFRDITEGNNGAFSAGPGWDACTGLGSPGGAAIIKVLASTGAGAAPKASTKAAAGKTAAKKTAKKAAKQVAKKAAKKTAKKAAKKTAA